MSHVGKFDIIEGQRKPRADQKSKTGVPVAPQELLMSFKIKKKQTNKQKTRKRIRKIMQTCDPTPRIS